MPAASQLREAAQLTASEAAASLQHEAAQPTCSPQLAVAQPIISTHRRRYWAVLMAATSPDPVLPGPSPGEAATKPPKFSPERAAARPKPLESGPQGLAPSALQTPGPRGATSPLPVLQQLYCPTESPRGSAKYPSFSLLSSRCPGCILFISCYCIGSHRIPWHHVSTSLVSCHHPGSRLIPCRTPPG